MQKICLSYDAKLVPVQPLNDELALCKCMVMALGKNRNKTYFSQEEVDKALPTINNIPVIGHLYKDENGKYRLGGHDKEIVKEDGVYKFKSVCIPYGCVPESHNCHYEEIEEPNGEVKTYLVADVILWFGRFPELKDAVYSEDVYFNQSMEINIEVAADDLKPLEEDESYKQVTNFTFSALCMLNKGDSENDPDNVTPCFPMANIQPYKYSFDEEFTNMMSEFKLALFNCFKKCEKGGSDMITEEKLAEIFTKFAVNKEDIDFDYSNMTEEELTTALEEFVASQSDIDTDTNDDDKGSKEGEVSSFALSMKQKMDKFSQFFTASYIEDESGDVIGFFFYEVFDFDDDYVYVVYHCDSADGYIKENRRYKYETVEDKLKIDESYTKMIADKWLTEEEAHEVDKARSQDQKLLAELKEFKANVEQQSHMAELHSVIKEFEDLQGIKEFEDLQDDICNKFDNADMLREKCYAIRGKNIQVKTNKKKSSDDMSFSINTNKQNLKEQKQDKTETDKETDEFFAKYGKKS